MSNILVRSGFTVYYDYGGEIQYADMNSFRVVPFLTYLKLSSVELFTNFVDLSIEEMVVGHVRSIYIVQSILNAKKIVSHVYSLLTTPLLSAVNIYKGANWAERECGDMHGILFVNHPDLRRILTDYGYKGHPLRKDFPLIGYIESFYDELVKAIIYVPVEMAQSFRDFNR